ncbi:M14 family metallopeptidase [Spirosoma aerophilum]
MNISPLYLLKRISFLVGCWCWLMGVPALAQQKTIPKPEETLGFPVGADFKLATYEQSLAYFKKLDEASDLIKLVHVGETSEGRPWYFALISSKKNLDNIDKYRAIAQRLAHPAELTDEDAKKLSLEGKPLVHIDGGLHASEVAGAQHTISLAYDMLSKADDPKMKNILDNVILLLWPSLNPDGQTMIGDWYKSNVGTPYEVAPPPFLYQKYVGHDNNRDAYMLNMIESRVVARTWREWEPNIIFVHHQTSPFPTRIWLPPFAEPIASQTPPIIAREVNMIGMAMAQALESNGQKGATHMGTGFDAWYPGYIDYMPVLQNIPAFWTETALYNYATPHFYTVRDFPKDKNEFRVESLYSSPWPGGWWRISDAMAYMETASLATLDYAAKYSDVLLYNRYQSGRNTIKKYEQEPPYAYFIPQKQRDPARPAELLRRLAFHGIRIGHLTKDVAFDGRNYPKGTWVIPMNQEYGELTKQLLDVQAYPDLREFPGGPPEQPYDAAGWTLPLQFELHVIPAVTPLPAEVKSAIQMVAGTPKDWKTDDKKDAYPADFVTGIGFDTNPVSAGIKAPEGRLTGTGTVALVNPAENNAFKVISRAMKAGGLVKYSKDAQKYAISGVGKVTLEGWIKDLGLTAELTANTAGATVKPRIAVYKPWTASMDEGWTHWVLEQFEVPFVNITNTDVLAGDLSDRFDVILIASDRPRNIKDGFAKGLVPPAYEGGLGELGASNLSNFVSQGGTLVCLNTSSDYAIEALHLPVKNVVAGVNSKDFFTGGSLLEIETDATHPVMAGMPVKAAVFVEGSPVFATLDGFKGQALATFASSGSPLRSGYLLGEKYLHGYAASLDVQHGKGHVILHGFRPQWRGQPLGTYRVLLNSVLYGGEVARGKYGSPEFWKSPVVLPVK